MRARTIPQNRKFSAMIGDVVHCYPLIPWKKSIAHEAWKRFFIAQFVREARIEAFGAHLPDPFPVRPVPSSSLSSEQLSDLIECVYWFASAHLNLILE